MKLRDIHLRDPFVFAENGVYYLYGTRRGPATNINPNERPGLFKVTETDDGFEIVECVET